MAEIVTDPGVEPSPTHEAHPGAESPPAAPTRSPVAPTAVVGRRIAGWFIDVALVAGSGLTVLLVLGDSYQRPGTDTGIDVARFGSDTAVFFRSTVAVVHPWEWLVTAVVAGLVAAALMVVLPGRRGWTPGLLAAELRLVDVDGGRPGVRRATVRFVAWLVDVLPGIPLVGYVAMRTGRHHQRVGDHLARTFVVDRAFVGMPPTKLATPEADDDPVPVPVLEDEEPDRGADIDETPEPSAVPSPPEGVVPDQPMWDRRRERYVLWRSTTGRWHVHDDEDQSWKPLAGP